MAHTTRAERPDADRHGTEGDAREMFAVVLRAWAQDVLTLRAQGMTRPRWNNPRTDARPAAQRAAA